jgi:hypothetical protein
MEDILDVYTRKYDEKSPLVCMDEVPKQLIGEVQVHPFLLPRERLLVTILNINGMELA